MAAQVASLYARLDDQEIVRKLANSRQCNLGHGERCAITSMWSAAKPRGKAHQNISPTLSMNSVTAETCDPKEAEKVSRSSPPRSESTRIPPESTAGASTKK